MSDRPSPVTASVRRIAKGVVILGSGVLCGDMLHRSYVTDHAKGLSLTRDQYAAGFEAYKTGLTAHFWPWWGDVLLVVVMIAMLALAYEAIGFGLAWAIGTVRQRLGHQPAAEAPSGPRQPSFWFLKAVLVGGMLVVTTGVGSYIWYISPYNVADGTDVFAVVAGRWAWASNDSGCVDDWHDIRFSADHKQMILTSAKPYRGVDGKPDSIAIYDIQRHTRSSIRGAIRGEARLQADHRPVVWDLVLRSPDRYAWHRTDWIAGAYTGEVHRCPPH